MRPMRIKNSALVLLMILALSISSGLARAGACSAEGAEAIDIDLSDVSAIVAFSQVSNMYAEPWNYVGAVIRIRGILDYYESEDGQRRDMIVVQDAAACCGQGIEIVWRNDISQSGPEACCGKEVTVTGRFDLCQEGGYSRIRLVDVSLDQRIFEPKDDGSGDCFLNAAVIEAP